MEHSAIVGYHIDGLSRVRTAALHEPATFVEAFYHCVFVAVEARKKHDSKTEAESMLLLGQCYDADWSEDHIYVATTCAGCRDVHRPHANNNACKKFRRAQIEKAGRLRRRGLAAGAKGAGKAPGKAAAVPKAPAVPKPAPEPPAPVAAPEKKPESKAAEPEKTQETAPGKTPHRVIAPTPPAMPRA